MNFWSKYPMVRLVIPFILGITIAIFAQTTTFIYIPILLALIFLFVFLIIKRKSFSNFSNQWLWGILLNIILLISGYSICINIDETTDNRHFSKVLKENSSLIVRINEQPEIKEKSIKLIGEALTIVNNRQSRSVKGNILLYLAKDASSRCLKYGDIIVINSKNIIETPPPRNPGSFDYKRYLHFKNIHYQAYLDKSSWTNTGKTDASPIFKLAYNLNSKILECFSSNYITGNEYGVLSSLIIGYKGHIDQDTLKAYTNSGTVHVLAVSGMHTGLIYFILAFSLSFLKRFRKGEMIMNIIIMALLWFYAVLTGLSGSVLRATVMISFIIIAKLINRNSNIFNTLAASAFSLLLFNPYLIADVGFQLSYFAVIGIVMIQPALYRLWDTKYYLLDQIWALITVSIAAQILATPLSILYFNQFPNYFLLSNLLIVPLSTIIIYLGLILLTISPLQILSEYLGKGIAILIKTMNGLASWIEHLPYSITEGLFITPLQVIILYIIIAFIIAFIAIRKWRYLNISLLAIIVFITTIISHNLTKQNQRAICIHSINKGTAISLIQKDKAQLIADSSMFNNSESFNYNIRNYYIEAGITKRHNTMLEATSPLPNDSVINDFCWMHNNYLMFAGKRLLIINRTFHIPTLSTNTTIDIAVITNNSYIPINKLRKAFNINTIVADASNSSRNTERIKRECAENGINYRTTKNNPAFNFQIQ